ncbi:cytochrome P450, family 71, subfamily B, polypeptide 34, partial [Prunus dulcis]
MHLKLGQLEAVIISSSKAAQEVLKTHELTFSQRPLVLAVQVMSFGQASIAFAPYGDFWKELRKICVFELLSAKRVQSFRSIREEEVGNLVESISSVSQQGVAINFSEKCFSLTNGIVSRAAFGKKCKDQKEFTSLLEEAIKLAGGFDIPDLFPSLRFLGYVTGKIPAMKRIRNKLGKILESIISDHMTKRSEDLIASRTTTGIDKAEEEEEEDFVDVLLKLQESNKLEFNFTSDQIKDVIMDIFSSGSETSATTIEWTISELMRNPRVMKKAQAEVRQVALEGKKNRIEEADVQKMDYLKSVVKETLRLHPPTPLLPREARERCQISGYELPLKSKFDFEFIPFGAGRRICPGIAFGVTMIELALSQLLCHFDWKLAKGIKPEEVDMTETFGVTCRRKSDLHLIATPRFRLLNESE